MRAWRSVTAQRSRLALSIACLISSGGQPVQEIVHLRIDQARRGGPGCTRRQRRSCRARCRCPACRAWRPGSARRHCRRRPRASARRSRPCVALAAAALDHPGAEIELRGVEILPRRQDQPPARLDRRRASCRRRRWRRSATSRIARRQARPWRPARSRRPPCPAASPGSRSTSSCAKLNWASSCRPRRPPPAARRRLCVLLDEAPVEQHQRILELRLRNALLGGSAYHLAASASSRWHAEAARQDLGDQRLRGGVAVLRRAAGEIEAVL